MLHLVPLATVLIVLLSAWPCSAVDYHLDSAGGDDANDGHAPGKAWKSLDRANQQTFAPGDRLLLKSGSVFVGQLAPKGSGAVVDGKPVFITLTRYGDGALPRIEGQGKVLDTLLLRNVDYWIVSELDITNMGAERVPWRTGVRLQADGHAMKSIRLTGLFVHDVNGDLRKSHEGCGIYFESLGGPAAKFEDLIIEKCHVVKTDRNGICQISHGRAARSTGVIVRNNLLEDIGGDAIKLWGSNGGLIEHNVVRGARTRCDDAAAGIWPFACDDTLIQYNEVCRVKGNADGTMDGQGFDSDYSCRNSVFQYNYSHDNEGGFILICAPGNSYCQKTIIRYNISQNDGLPGSRVFHFGGFSTDALVHNNTIYIGKDRKTPLFKFTEWSGGEATNTRIFNNLFIVDGQVSYHMGKSVGTTFESNIYIGHHDKAPHDAHPAKMSAELTGPGTGGDGFDSLKGYRWKASGSPPRGMKLEENAKTDFFGTQLPTGRPPCIGACEKP